MNYVKSIKTSARCGAVATLGLRTLLLGPNGSGKTAIVNGIELAAGQFASDVENRITVKQGAMLGRLGAVEGRALRAEIELASGNRAEFLLKANPKGGFHRPEVTPLDGFGVAFPVLEVRRVLGMTPEAIRRWLLGKVGSEISRQRIVDLLDPEYAAEYLELVKTYDTTPKKKGAEDEEDDDLFSKLSEVEKFLAVVKDAEGKAKTLVKEADRAKATLDAVLGDADTIPDDETIEQMAKDLKEAQARQQALQTGGAPVITLPAEPMRASRDAFLTSLTDELLTARRVGAAQALDGQKARLQELRTIHHGLPQPTQDAEIALSFVTAIDRAAPFVAGDSLQCPVCSTRAPVALVKQRRSQWEAFCRGEAEKQQQRRYIEQQFASIAAFAKEQETAIGLMDAEIDYRKARAAWKAECERLALTPRVLPIHTAFEEIQAEITQKIMALGQARQRKEQWERQKGEMARIKKDKKRATALTDLATQGEEVIMKLLVRAQSTFVTRVQQFLPARYTFGLALFDKKKNPICRMGFLRDGEIHTALSGAEMVCLTLALAAAVQPELENRLSIFVPEERALSPETLTLLMESLEAIPGQVILQSPVAPTTVPDGWTVVFAPDAAEQGMEAGYGP